MLQSLVDLARHTSSDSRRDMLHALSRLFVDGADAHNDRELLLFGEILTRLLDQVGEDDRLALSRRVSRTAQTPHDLAFKLAQDRPLIAAPILEYSPVLTVQDLVGIASEASQEHLAAIARRAGIVEPITDVIVGRGELPVLNTVVRNLSARFKPAALDEIAILAGSEPALGDGLSLRPDLPVATARKIITSLRPEARKRVEALLRQNGDRVADLMGRAMQLLDQSRQDPNQHRNEVRKMLADIRSNHRTVDDALDHLVFQKRLTDIALLLAELASVPESHVSGVLHKVNASGIGVICRLLGVGEAAFRRLSSLRCEKLRLPFSQTEQMVRDYAGINELMAEQSLRYHRNRTSLTGTSRG